MPARTSPPTASRRQTSPSRSIVAAFWDYFEELHRWRGRYGRRALWLRSGSWLVALLLAQFVLAALSLWLLALAPLALASMLWVLACSIAKRLRDLQHAVWSGTLVWLLLCAALAVFGRDGAQWAAALLAAPDAAWRGPFSWRGLVFWASMLALAGFALYIALAPAGASPHDKKRERKPA